MKTLLMVASVLSTGVSAAENSADAFVVHEWGTFTTALGSDGKLRTGLEREESPLPPFVHSHAGFAPANKGWNRPVANVTVKMETPVIYFYTPRSRSVKVEVRFHGGSISQWYPERTGGETLPPPPSGKAITSTLPPVDFAAGYEGSASWQVDVLGRDTNEAISARTDWETPQWPRARVAEANKIRGPGNEVEGFIFYRGVGNFSLPLTTELHPGNAVLHNRGADDISFAFVYEKSTPFSEGVVRWKGPVRAGTDQIVHLIGSDGDEAAAPVIEQEMPRALERAGLSASEARAMIATWRESYFGTAGVRVFWIVPRAFTDRILPMTITPAPDKLERVLVGRSELVTRGPDSIGSIREYSPRGDIEGKGL